MGKKGPAKVDKLVLALLINALVLALAFVVLVFIYFDKKKADSRPRADVVASVYEASSSQSARETETENPLDKNYRTALEALDDGDVKKALRYFNTMPDFKDSAHYSECLTKYISACEKFEKFEIDEAIEILRDCDGVYNSNERADDYEYLGNIYLKTKLGEFDGISEDEVCKNVKTLTNKEVRFFLLAAEARGMLYLSTFDEYEKVGQIIVDLSYHMDWLESLPYEGAHEVYGVPGVNGPFYGAPDNPAYSRYAYGPLDDGDAALFLYYTDADETEYYYNLMYEYFNADNKEISLNAYFDKDGNLMHWSKYER